MPPNDTTETKDPSLQEGGIEHAVQQETEAMSTEVVQHALGEVATQDSGYHEEGVESYLDLSTLSLEELKSYFEVQTDNELVHALVHRNDLFPLVCHLSSLRNLDASVGDALVFGGYAGAVSCHLDSFEQLHDSVVKKVMGRGFGVELVDSYERLGLDGRELLLTLVTSPDQAWLAFERIDIAGGTLTYNDLATKLAESGLQHILVKNLYRCRDLSVDIARYLAGCGELGRVIVYLEFFDEEVKHVVPTLAYENGKPDLIASNLNKFDDLDFTVLAHQLLDHDMVDDLRLHIGYFKGLDRFVAERIIDRQDFVTILRNPEAFTDLDVTWLAETYIASGNHWTLIDNRPLFPELTDDLIIDTCFKLEKVSVLFSIIDQHPSLARPDIADRVLGTPDERQLLRHLHSFPELDKQALAFSLIERGEADELIRFAQAFAPRDAERILERLFETGYGRAVTMRLSSWQGIDYNKFAHMALDNDCSAQLGIELTSFKDTFDLSVAKKMAALGLDAVTHITARLYAFKELDDEVLRAILGDDDPEGLSDNLLGERAEYVKNYLYLFHNVSERSMHDLREITKTEYLTAYPNNGSDWEKDTWYGTHAYVRLDGGFSKRAMGRVMRHRIEHQLEHGLHDVSQWLDRFEVPEKGYDITAILRNRQRPDFDPSQYEEELFEDHRAERAFFAAVLDAPIELRHRLLLSVKEGVEQSLFSYLEHQIMYRVLVSGTEGGEPFYKQESLTFDMLREAAFNAGEDYLSNTFGHDKDRADTNITPERLKGIFLYDVSEPDYQAHEEMPAISASLQYLKTLGQRRQAYIQSAESWLLKHATSPNQRLSRVWPDRGRSLLNKHVKDNASSIAAWQKENALTDLIQDKKRRGEEYSIDLDDVMGDALLPVRAELLRVLSAEQTLDAILKRSRWLEEFEQAGGKKVLPAEVVPVVLEDVPVSVSKPFTFEVLPADDPRGFTIGEDTGCCMKIDGLSKSCIKAGYSMPNAGFMAMYTPSGDIAAQSFWYVHPEHSDTIVVDNIEANEGRDMGAVLTVYTEALKQYIDDHPDLGISKVHVGTGYSDVNLTHLETVKPVPELSERVYTDAYTQKLLYEKAGA